MNPTLRPHRPGDTPIAGDKVHLVNGDGEHLEGEVTHVHDATTVDVAIHRLRLVCGWVGYAEPAAGQEYSWHWPEAAIAAAPVPAPPGFWRAFGRRAAGVGLSLLKAWGTAKVTGRR